ncbi:MAG TPA: hypothetical protein PLK30_23635 [Blastocatellia bacterium]|nr:hypothetical protein [Blastocatellia bacterium]
MFNFVSIKSEETVIGFVILVLLSLLLYKHWKGQAAPAPSSANQELEISQLIQKVKQELEAADQQREADGKAALFRAETFQLEVNFVVKETDSAKASGNFEVVTVGGQTGFSHKRMAVQS